MADGTHMIIAEIESEVARVRSPQGEGFTLEKDIENNKPGDLALASSAYASQIGTLLKDPRSVAGKDPPQFWPAHFRKNMYKAKDFRQALIKAAALLVMELERLDHEAPAEAAPKKKKRRAKKV